MVRKSINILLLYSLLSSLVTLAVAVFLSLMLIGNMERKIIDAHSDFYRSFVEAIPTNYSEILSELGISDETAHEDEGHGEDEHNDDVWQHFNTDLIQTPSIRQFRIFDRDLHEAWSYSRELSDHETAQYPSMVEIVDREVSVFHIMSRKPDFVIHYYFPIFYEGLNVGTVEITDIDFNLKELLISSRSLIIRTVLISGMILYISLFALFLKSYRNQKKAISRLDKSQSLTIHTMSLLAELRDANTGSHIIRTSRYCRAMAIALSKEKKYSRYINANYIEDMERSAPLHDIGKVGIPDKILNKAGKLTDDEFDIVKKHPVYGAEVLETAMKSLDFQSYFEIGYQIVLHHHENWDGTGYPEGLKGELIPLSARIMALADVYDALRSDRPYKKAFTHEKALEIIRAESGKKLDPRIVDFFDLISEEFRLISES